MECNKFATLEGCSNCKYLLSDSKYISQLDSFSIIDVLDELAEQCNLLPNNKVLLNESIIDCRGNISIVYHNNDINIPNNYTRYIYYSILSRWLKYNLTAIRSSINIIYLVLCACILYFNEKDQKALELIGNLQVLLNYVYNYIKILQRNKDF